VADLVDAGLLRTTLTANVGPFTAANLRRVHSALEAAKPSGISFRQTC
jgi:hypothetical protein